MKHSTEKCKNLVILQNISRIVEGHDGDSETKEFTEAWMLSPLSCSPKHHVLMGWLDPEPRNQPHHWYAKLPWTNLLRLRATRKDANPQSSRARGTTVATRRRSATASTVEPTELIDGLPWLS
jgi:hypothetical protein|eukprot:COSAG02_NODE_3066_length_7432_cov_38.244511_4_plen_123_part_00